MASVVNTNISSLNAQRQLSKTQAASNEAMERLSSGLRINSAKDDAAGLAISTGMQSQIKGINMAVRNANDGVSMAQTAEGAMDGMTNILQRMRELAVQSANDTNSDANREAIQGEVSQLHSELDRIAETTEYNGTTLLNGSGGSTTLQIGANSGQSLTFSIDSVTTNDLELNGDLNKGDLNGGRVTGTLTESSVQINGVVLAAPAPVDAILGAYTIAAFDDCAGHINLVAGYHYHGEAGCSQTQIQSDGHAAMMGYALDGFGIFGMLNEDGLEPTDLDECRGHTDDTRGYHYHAADVSENMFIGCFKGATAR